MYYAVKIGRVPGIYEDKTEALAQTFRFPYSEMRIFEERDKAEEYLKNDKQLYFVVVRGRVPGVYYSKQDVSCQVKDFEGAIVRTFKDESKAKDFFKNVSSFSKEKLDKMTKSSISSEKKKEMKESRKNDYYEKIQKYLKDGISTHGDVICFIDVEANDNKAISLGAICYNQKTKRIVNTFYSLMKYDSFVDKNYYETSIHNIPNEEILKAKSSDEVFTSFIDFCKENKVSDIFSWGNRDKEFLKKSLTDKSLMEKICKIRNVQTFISAIAIDYKESIERANISLQKAKTFYGIEGEVVHNALKDAFDLQKVFVCFQEQRTKKEEEIDELSYDCAI